MIDCFDGLPVAWTIGTSPSAELANTMLDTATAGLNPDEHEMLDQMTIKEYYDPFTGEEYPKRKSDKNNLFTDRKKK